MINGLVMTAEETERVQAALVNADAVMLGYMQRMRTGLAAAGLGIAAAAAGIRGLGEAFAALKPDRSGDDVEL